MSRWSPVTYSSSFQVLQSWEGIEALFCPEENKTARQKKQKKKSLNAPTEQILPVIYAALSRGLSSRPSESHLRHAAFPLASRSSRRSSEEAPGVGGGVGGHRAGE